MRHSRMAPSLTPFFFLPSNMTLCNRRSVMKYSTTPVVRKVIAAFFPLQVM
jgi:hypothetical protein